MDRLIDSDIWTYGLNKTTYGNRTRTGQWTSRFLLFGTTYKAIIINYIACLTIHLYLFCIHNRFPSAYNVYIYAKIPLFPYHKLIYITTDINFPSYIFPNTFIYVSCSSQVYSFHLCGFYRLTFRSMILHCHYIDTSPLTLTCSSVCLYIVSVLPCFYNSTNIIYLGVFNQETLALVFNTSGKSKSCPLCKLYQYFYRVLSINSIIKSCKEYITNSVLFLRTYFINTCELINYYYYYYYYYYLN